MKVFNFSLALLFSLRSWAWVRLLGYANVRYYSLSNLQVKFGEPQDLDSQELFGWISSFISEFRKACAEVMP